MFAKDVPMDRETFLKDRRQLAESRFDNLWAPIYDQEWGASISPKHQQWMQNFLNLCPPGGLILDAACGTGKYWPLILGSGRHVFGIDQSQGMLDHALSKFPEVTAQKLGLQEMRFLDRFDGAICIDSMECVFPEDWLPVLNNFFVALKPGGVLYFTVELAAEEDIAAAFEDGKKMGFPLVYGEWILAGGYHFYPPVDKVREWLGRLNWEPVDECAGDDYHHFLVRKPLGD
jgi:SAM-dependent methyltransferase